MIKRLEDSAGWGWILGREAWLWLWLPIILISAAHYSTSAAHFWLHDIFRRLYYIPIVLGAFLLGVRGSLSAAFIAAIIYAPHAFTHFSHHDPGQSIEKILEILLYFVVALITGVLADGIDRERRRQEALAKKLAEALDELKLMEQQLIRAGRLQALGELTAGLAHEIKNPLASLKGATDIIADEIPENSPRRKMVGILKTELARLDSLLERFLSFARPDALNVGDVSLREVIEKSLLLVEAQFRQSRVELRRELPAEGCVVRADLAKIEQVLINILLNATQMMPDGGVVVVRCEPAIRGKSRYGIILVEDTGPGIPDIIKEKIFNPFFTTRENGTGLGLSIAARIVDRHGGFIEADNRPEGGAVFRIFLPVPD